MAKPAQRHAPSRVSELDAEAATIGLCSLETVRAAREERWSSQSRRPPSALGPPDTRAPTIFNTPNLSDSLHSVLRHRPASASPLHTTAAQSPMLRQQQQQLAGSTAWLAQPSRAAVLGSGQASTPHHNQPAEQDRTHAQASVTKPFHPAAATQTSKSWGRPASAVALKSAQQCQPSSVSSGGGGAADGAGWDVPSRPGLQPPSPALASFHSFKLPPQHQLQQHQNLRAAQRQQPATQEQPYLPPSSSPRPSSTLQRPLPPRPSSSLKNNKAMSQGGALPLAVTPGPSPPSALAPTPTPSAGQPPLPRSSSRGRGAPSGGQALGLGGRLLPQWVVAGLQEHQLLQSQPPQFSPEEVTLTTSQTSHQRVRVRPSSSPPTHCPTPLGLGHSPGPPSVPDPTPAISPLTEVQLYTAHDNKQQQQQQQQERRLSKHSSSGTGGGEGQAARSCLLPGGLDLPCLVPTAPLPALGSSSQGHSRPPSACRPGSGVREGGGPLAPASTSPPRPGSAASTRPGSALSSRVVGGEGGGGGAAADLARVSPWGLAALHQVPKGVPCVVDTEVDDQEVAVTLAIAEAQETGQAQLSDRAMQQLPAQASPHAAMQPWVRFLRSEGSHLTSLELSRNALLSSPPLELTQSLTSLDLSHNALTQLPSTLGLLLRLQQLVLDSNKLTALPDVCTQLTALTLISVRDNQLGMLPAGLGCLSLLRQLKVSDNQLQCLPSSTSLLTSLQLLDLAGNQLTGLPPGLGCMEQMRSLDVSRNHLSALPISIGGMHRCLSSLRLEHNQLSVLPRELALLTTLSHLTLHGNPLVHPPRQVAAEGALAVRVYLSSHASALPACPPNHLPMPNTATAQGSHALQPNSPLLTQRHSDPPAPLDLATPTAGSLPTPMLHASLTPDHTPDHTIHADQECGDCARGAPGSRAPMGRAAGGAQGSVEQCRQLTLDLEEQGKWWRGGRVGELLLRVQLEREAFEQRCAHLAAELDKVTKQAHGLDQESKALAQELKGVADPPCLPDGTACSSADALLLAREVRRLHAELRAAEGELGASQQRVQEAQEAAEQQRTRAAMAFSAAGAAQRALAEVEELKEQLAAAKQQESRLQALLAHHLGQQRAAEDKCLEAEARLDALSLGLLDGLTAETQHLRGQADQQAAAARTSAAQAAAREAALMAQVSCLQASLAALAEERQVVHEAGAAAAKVHATTALSQLQRLAQAKVFASPVNWERDGTY